MRATRILCRVRLDDEPSGQWIVLGYFGAGRSIRARNQSGGEWWEVALSTPRDIEDARHMVKCAWGLWDSFETVGCQQ